MFDFLKTAKWNNEPNQEKLATMLWEAATYEVTHGSQGKSLNIPEWAALRAIADDQTKKRRTDLLLPLR